MKPDSRRRSAPRALRRTMALPFVLAVAGAVLPVAAQAQTQAQEQTGAAAGAKLERRIKAAFLYKFLGYADFPSQAFEDAVAPLTIGVIGADDMAAELARIAAGRMIGGRPVVVRAVHEQELGQPLHLLFVAGADAARSARLLRASAAYLTVTECPDGLAVGSIINFTIVQERVRFDVSLDAAEKKNVKLSSRLLTVANRVQKGTT